MKRNSIPLKSIKYIIPNSNSKNMEITILQNFHKKHSQAAQKLRTHNFTQWPEFRTISFCWLRSSHETILRRIRPRSFSQCASRIVVCMQFYKPVTREAITYINVFIFFHLVDRLFRFYAIMRHYMARGFVGGGFSKFYWVSAFLKDFYGFCHVIYIGLNNLNWMVILALWAIVSAFII